LLKITTRIGFIMRKYIIISL